jgi:hypothetical protein
VYPQPAAAVSGKNLEGLETTVICQPRSQGNVRGVVDKKTPGRLTATRGLSSGYRRSGRPATASSVGKVNYFGSITESMTWITPFEAAMSVAVTLAPSTLTLPSFTAIFTD